MLILQASNCEYLKAREGLSQMKAGTAQGSIVGLNLLSALYNCILRLEMLDLVGYVADAAAQVTMRTVQQA